MPEVNMFSQGNSERRARRWHLRKITFFTGSGFLVIVAVVAALWSSLGTGERKDHAWLRMKSEGVIRVGVDPSYPPFEFQDGRTGELKGYDVELAQEVGRRLGVRVEFVLVGFDSLYDALRSGKVDAVISGVPYDPSMTQNVAYGIWYFNAGQFLVVRVGDDHVRRMADLVGRKLGVELGSTGDLEARKLQGKMSGLTLQAYETADGALSALVDGEVDAALVDSISAYQFMAKHGGVRLVEEAVLDESYAVVTDRRSTQLRAAVDQVILQLKADGFFDRLRDRWLLNRTS